MTYESFQSLLIKQMQSFLMNKYENVEVEIHRETKQDGNAEDYLLFMNGGKDALLSTPLGEFYESYIMGMSLLDIFKEVQKRGQLCVEIMQELNGMEMTFEGIKDRLIVQLMNADEKADILKNVPHERREDLVLVYRVAIFVEGKGVGCYYIKNEDLKKWGITQQQCSQAAWENTRRLCPIKIREVGDTLKELQQEATLSQPFEVPDVPESSMKLYIVTNEQGQYGAAYLFDREKMKEIADQLNSNLIVLPSSVHEILICKESAIKDAIKKYPYVTYEGGLDSIRNLVKTTNETVLTGEEWLSDEIYFCDRKTGEIRVIPDTVQEQGMWQQM